MANSSFDIKKANNHTKNPTSYKRFCNNLYWEHLKSKVKKKIYLGDNFCRSLFVLCPLDILLSVRLRFMDSDYLFGIFKLVLHIKSKELLAQA
jgi:hypothetical protein